MGILNFRNLIIEVLGTFMLVFYGGMAGNNGSFTFEHTDPHDSTKKITDGVYKQTALQKGDIMYGVALCHGLILGIWIYAGSSNGGDCHYNPAVTLGMILLRKCQLIQGLLNMAAQAAGSFLGALCCMALSLPHTSGPLTIMNEKPPADNPNISPVFLQTVHYSSAALIETFNTFFLMIVILCFTGRKDIPKEAYGGAIGLVLFCMICGTGNLTGCSANPFRALGPCVLGGEFYPLLVHLIWPFVGSCMACLFYRNLVDYDFNNDEAKDSALQLNDLTAEFRD